MGCADVGWLAMCCRRDWGYVHTDTRQVWVPVYTGFDKHEFECIPIAAVHNNTGSVYEYELPLKRAVFV